MNTLAQTAPMTIVQLTAFDRGDWNWIYTVTTRNDATGGHEVTGLTRAEYDQLFQRLYQQHGVTMLGKAAEDGRTWTVGYIDDLARECAAPILPAVINRERAIEYDDILPARMP